MKQWLLGDELGLFKRMHLEGGMEDRQSSSQTMGPIMDKTSA